MGNSLLVGFNSECGNRVWVSVVKFVFVWLFISDCGTRVGNYVGIKKIPSEPKPTR